MVLPMLFRRFNGKRRTLGAIRPSSDQTQEGLFHPSGWSPKPCEPSESVVATPGYYEPALWSRPIYSGVEATGSNSSDSSGFSQNGFIPDDKTRNKCCDVVEGRALEEICYYVEDVTKDLAQSRNTSEFGCSCVDYLFCKLVVVSSVSSNHMKEAKKMIASVQKHMPNTKIVMYSLGLTAAETQYLRCCRNMELHSFDFDKYPSLDYCKDKLFNYGWKPMVVKEASERYEVIMYFDSSVRLSGSIDANVLKHLLTYPGYIAGPWFGTSCYNTNHPIVSYTADAMLSYLFPEKSNDMDALRRELAPMGHLPSGCYIIWMNSEMKEKVLESWVDCGLNEECMAPPGTHRFGCKINNKHNYTADGAYVGCHRFDQSSLDLIIYREFGLTYVDNICHRFVFKLFPIERW